MIDIEGEVAVYRESDVEIDRSREVLIDIEGEVAVYRESDVEI